MEFHLPCGKIFRIYLILGWQKILCAICSLQLGNRSREKFLKIANRPVPILSRTAFTEPEVSFDKLRAYYAVKNQEWMEERIWNFEYDLKNLASLSPYAAIHFIRKGIGYDEFLKTYADERNVNADDWFDVLDEMQEMARDKKSIPGVPFFCGKLRGYAGGNTAAAEEAAG